MSEVIDRAIEYMPYIGAAAGALAGSAADMLAQHQHAQDQEALTGVLGDIAHDQPKEPIMSRIRRAGGATLLIAGATVGALNGLAWQPEASQSLPPTLGVVVDHSGAVQANDEVLQSVNGIAEVFDNKSFDATAYVAVGGEVLPMQPSKVSGSAPFGEAPLSQAMTTAFGENQKERERTGNANKTGIVAIVNGNEIGAPDAVIATAKAQGNTAIFAVNVEGDANPTAVQDLQRIAKETGGAYFDVQSDNTKKMAGKVQDTLEKNQFMQDQPNRWPLKIFAGALGVGTIFTAFRNRRKEPTYKQVR